MTTIFKRPITTILNIDLESEKLITQLQALCNICDEEKLYIDRNRTIHIDKSYIIIQPLIRFIFGRGREKTVIELNKIFEDYFLLLDNIIEFESNNKQLLEFHTKFILKLANGLSKLVYTYENSKDIRQRLENIITKIFIIHKTLNKIYTDE